MSILQLENLMKVLVVFHLPRGAGLPYCSLDHLMPLIPVVKSTYTFNHLRYEVVAVNEDMDTPEGPLGGATNK